MLLKTYDRRATPTHADGTPTLVSVEIFLRSFGSINPATMDYEVDLYLRQSWVDKRLHVDNLTHELDLSDPQLVLNIWKPEVYFPNAKLANFQYVTVPNVLVRIYPGGYILYMLRLKLTFSCMLNLAKYPLDRQICAIELSSWDYSCLRAEFVLERSVGYHLVQSYLPTTMIVIVSWVSFWLDNHAIPARVTLGVTTLLTISSESTGIRAHLPPVSYVKALDVWMGTCTTFVFAALIEFTVVNYLFRKKEASNTNTSKTSGIHRHFPKCNKCLMHSSALSEKSRSSSAPRSAEMEIRLVTASYIKSRLLAKKIDCTCRVAFPLAYLFFNIFYWTYYMI
uniref:Neurotransmitter-gated ion-channel ligand-binding domain-containing protein n=1 Tax=Strigamia maritima TaxID=126957 RepID=T1JG08_STRMM